jgi:hypothetical protein
MDRLNFYQHGFFSNPHGDVHQRVNLFDAKCPGVYDFMQVSEGGTEEDEQEEDEEVFTVWILRHRGFDNKSSPLWKGNLSSQSILDAVVKQFVK